MKLILLFIVLVLAIGSPLPAKAVEVAEPKRKALACYEAFRRESNQTIVGSIERRNEQERKEDIRKANEAYEKRKAAKTTDLFSIFENAALLVKDKLQEADHLQQLKEQTPTQFLADEFSTFNESLTNPHLDDSGYLPNIDYVDVLAKDNISYYPCDKEFTFVNSAKENAQFMCLPTATGITIFGVSETLKIARALQKINIANAEYTTLTKNKLLVVENKNTQISAIAARLREQKKIINDEVLNLQKKSKVLDANNANYLTKLKDASSQVSLYVYKPEVRVQIAKSYCGDLTLAKGEAPVSTRSRPGSSNTRQRRLPGAR